MLKYLKKFILDILPSVVATIVGAYIVHHYVIPAATPNNPSATMTAAEPKPDASLAAERDSFAKGVAEKAAIEKTAEKAAEKSSEVVPAESRRRHPAPRTAPRPAAATPDQTANTNEPAPAEERRDANDLARAAIERLRASSEPPRGPASTTPPPARNETASAVPALPPPVTLPPPNSDVFRSGTGAVTPARLPPATRSADASRPTPPAAIPDAPPIELHGEDTVGRATVADDMMSAAKSVFHAVLPR